jgi:FkbM family methyltransferase
MTLQVREGTTDMMTVKSIGQYKSCPIPANSVVLDIGGHIGTFSVWAVEQGAGRVVAYEPEPDNYRMLCLNTAGMPVETNNFAVTSDGRDVELHVKTSGHTGGHSILFGGKSRKNLLVKSQSFLDIVQRVQPQVVKIDCEGAEYEFDLPNSLPDSVQYVTMEIHLNRKMLREYQAPTLIEGFSKWTAIKEPKITPKGWQAIAVWGR